MAKKETKNNTGRGFTLIELLLVISIIGLLSSVVLSSTAAVRSRARDVRRQADIVQVGKALDLYMTDHGGSFPCVNYHSEDPNVLSFLVSSGYMARAPHDPLSDTLHGYSVWSYQNDGSGNCKYMSIQMTYENRGNSCAVPGNWGEASYVGEGIHCHNMFPEPLPCPNNPYDNNDFDISCTLPLRSHL